MRFEITFHTPFRVASGQAGDGSDTTVDPGALLPASSLKGIMRSAARDLLRFPASLVEEVFGAAWTTSPWSWSDARVLGAGRTVPGIRPRARIQIDPQTSTTVTGALLIADEVLASQAQFTIERTGWIKAAGLGRHETVLLAAGRAVTAIGGNRRRGLGWVTVTPVDPPWSPAHLDSAAQLAGGESDG
jgi:CRISPR/Cas system CSM-associated protein Csm3 (group 7 of RAMP superfamily)